MTAGLNVPCVTFAGVSTTLTDGFQRSYTLEVEDGVLDAGDQALWQIIGDSGSGKTTLLRLLGLVDGAKRGTITWHLPGEEPLSIVAGQREDAWNRRRLALFRRHFGFAFQHAPLQPQLTVIENLHLWRQLADKPPQDEDAIIAAAKPLFTSSGQDGSAEDRVRKLLRCYPFEALSMGEKQRFVLLQSLAHDPSVLFVDEPTANLDRHSAAQVDKFISAWACRPGSPRLVLWVTHLRHDDAEPRPCVRVHDGKARIFAAPASAHAVISDRSASLCEAPT